MTSQTAWARIIQAVSRPHSVPSEHERAELLHETLLRGAEVVPDLVGCSITQVIDTDQGRGYRTPVASNDLAVVLDRAQYAMGDGPCVAACRDDTSHSIAVMDDEAAFPGFTAAALEHDVHSSLSLPLTHARPSAVNLYAGDPDAFAGQRPRAGAAFLARCVSGLLPEAKLVEPEQALDAESAQRRRLIEQACATLTAGHGCRPEQAFHQLTVLSRDEQRSVYDIARTLVGNARGDSS